MDREAKRLQEEEDETDGASRKSNRQGPQSPGGLGEMGRSIEPSSGLPGSVRGDDEGRAELNQTRNSALSRASKDKSPTSGLEDQDAKPQEAASKPKDVDVESEIVEEDDPELKDGALVFQGVEGGHDLTTGAKLTFTYNEGLVVQIQPNGDVLQKIMKNAAMPKSQTKGNHLVQDQEMDSQIENQRIITTTGEIIKHMGDGNFIIYYTDGTLTYSDKRRATWYTINSQGVKRVRKLKGRVVTDEVERLKTQTKVDPETNATLKIREDGVLSIEYIDQTHLIVMPDGTNILKKKRSDGEAGTVTLITKDGYVPIR